MTASTVLPLLLPTRAEAAPSYTEGAFVFSTQTIFPGPSPDDAVDTINYTGSMTSNEGLWYLKNLCGGTPSCTPRDIYITVVMTASGATETVSPEYHSKIEYGAYTGLTEPAKKTDQRDCDYTLIDHGIWPDSSEFTCAATFNDIIPSDEIDWDNADAQEYITWEIAIAYITTIDLNFSITISTSPPSGCQDQYLAGSKFASVTLLGTDEDGVNITASSGTGWPTVGSWVKAVVTGIGWQDDGGGAYRYDLAIQRQPVAAWSALSDYAFTGCSDYADHTYYFQISSTAAHYLRVNDDGGNFASNIGWVGVDLYSVSSYTAYPSTCEANYERGPLLESNSVMATASWGVPIGTGISSELPFGLGGESGPEPGSRRYLWLEVTGAFFNGTYYTSLAEILDGVTPYEIDLWPAVVCATQLDTLGKYRIIFPYTSSDKGYLAKFLAYDLDSVRTNNTGTLGYNLYYADYLADSADPQSPPEENGCTNYTHEGTGTEYTLDATLRQGVAITLTGGDMYAVETSEGPWSNNGSSSYDVGISDDGGVTWYQLYDYPGSVCSQTTDTDHYVTYFQALTGKSYKLRAQDAGDVYADNDDDITVTVYGATAPDSQWLPCSQSYVAPLVQIPDDQRTIPAQNSDGVGISYITAGNIYGLEITDEHAWRPLGGSVDMYTAQVSDDGGATWQDMPTADFVSCAVYISTDTDESNARYRIYFTADGSYRIRVKGSAWASNQGYLMYKLYKVDSVVDLPDPNPDPQDPGPYIPPEWGQACYTACNRPTSVFVWSTIASFSVSFGTLGTVTFPGIPVPMPDAAGWLEYGRCGLQKYLAWCPEHSEALAAAGDDVLDRYPFLYISEAVDLFEFVNDTIYSFEWSDNQVDGGGEVVPQTFSPSGGEPAQQGDNFLETILPVLDDTSPWNGGDVTFVPAVGGGEISDCQLAFESRIGATMTQLFCGVSNLLDSASLSPKLRFYFNIGAVLLFAVWLYNYVNRTIDLLEKL